MALIIASLNKILDELKASVAAHPELKDFGYGQVSEIGTSRSVDYPLLWVTHQSDSYIRIENKTTIPELRLVLLFMDQVDDQQNYSNSNGEQSHNGQEIMSDTFQMLQDIINTIMTSFQSIGIMISEDVRCFPVFDELPDRVNGWGAEITLRVKYLNSDC
jgi:hypothetical protein